MCDAKTPSEEKGSRHGVFATTHWSVVLRAGSGDSPQSHSALANLCQTYWPPLYGFIRRQGHSPHDAEDLTQEFFERLIEKNYIADAQVDKGKFRTFLLVAVKRFLANEWHRARALKRGGGVSVVSINQTAAETAFDLEPKDVATADRLFEQRWALTLLDTVLTRLRDEQMARAKSELFNALREALMGEKAATTYAEIARRFGITEAAVKMTVQRLRRRYRELLREEVAKTVADAEDIDAEIRHLFAVFAR